MSRARWRIRLGPPATVMGTAALLSIAAAALTAAPPPPAVAASCPTGPWPVLRAAIATAPAAAARVRVSERLGTRGQFAGRHVSITTAGGQALELDLPAESSVAARQGNAVVYTRVEGARSEVHVVDLLTGCDHLVAQPAGIVRSALLDGDGDAVFVHAVKGPGRTDNGVTRYSLADDAALTVVPPLPTDERYGPTFGTQLAWSADGETLAIQSCGADACRTRLLDVASGAIATLDEVPHGALIGVTGSHLVAHGPCHWSPCEVVAIERATGVVRLLAEEAFSAELASSSDGTTVVAIGTAAGTVEVAP